MNFLRKLPIPKEIKAEYPLTEKMMADKAARDEEIAAIFRGESDRFLLVIGPCSADSKEPVMEYLRRLRLLDEKVKDKIMIIPRVYTNKPRTTGDGYKGMLHQPDPHAKPDMLKGIIAIRDIHMSALADYGFSCADEMLYPENYRYLSDLLSYVAIGARSVENQQHRLVASGLEVPAGMKNPTTGDLSIMMNSVTAAQHRHTFLYRGWEVESNGNPYAHAILRGYQDGFGNSRPNYHYENLEELYSLFAKSDLKNPAVLVDCNHANSGKNYLEQIRIVDDILYSCRKNKDLRGFVKGVMIESYLEDGAQKMNEYCFGKSFTDPCLGWEKTERLVMEMAEKL